MSLAHWLLITNKLKHVVLLVIKVCVGNLLRRKKKVCIVFYDKKALLLVAKGQRTVYTKYDKDPHASCSLNFDLALCSI